MKKSTPDLFILLKLIAIVISLGTTQARADSLAATVGSGNLKTHETEAVFLSYQKDAPKLFNFESFYDLTLGTWSGPTSNSALTLARAVRWRPSPEYYFAGTLGIGLVNRITDHLGTYPQFFMRFAVGRQYRQYDLSIGETHYSNGRTLFGWDGANTGEDFLTVMLAREF